MIALTPRAIFFFFNDTAPTEIYTLSLHDALPIYDLALEHERRAEELLRPRHVPDRHESADVRRRQDRKSTRLNSSHANISYAVFCLKKKNKNLVFLLVLFSQTRLAKVHHL